MKNMEFLIVVGAVMNFLINGIESMEFVNLGKSSLSVSKVCLGTMTWGQQNTESEGIEQLNVAFSEYGVNFLDVSSSIKA